jgi:D-allulose-6-phosphate 3-epimerase
MCLDLLRPESQLDALSRRADIGHLDIMDGHFAPNLAISPGQVRAFRQASSLPMEAHLMVTNPEFWIDVFAETGVEEITIHRETIDSNAFRLIRRIRELGRSPGLALCPATPVEHAAHLLDSIGVLAIMTVDVGYSGQKFIPQMLQKVESARELREKYRYNYEIQVDGGCGLDTFNALRQAGADRFVLGSSLFGYERDINAAFDRVLREYKEATGEEPR